MRTFTSNYRESFTSSASVATAVAAFADTETIAQNHGGLSHAEQLGDGRIAYVLAEQNHGVTRFRGRYTCKYTATDAQTVEWHTEPGGNMTATGKAVFEGTPGGCRIDYQAKLTIDLDVGRLAGALIGPVFDKLAQRGQRAYVERMIAAAESRRPS